MGARVVGRAGGACQDHLEGQITVPWANRDVDMLSSYMYSMSLLACTGKQVQSQHVITRRFKVDKNGDSFSIIPQANIIYVRKKCQMIGDFIVQTLFPIKRKRHLLSIPPCYTRRLAGLLFIRPCHAIMDPGNASAMRTMFIPSHMVYLILHQRQILSSPSMRKGRSSWHRRGRHHG
jgi:hypothetical protein